ncbi:putative low molecular weight protein-tyrosine-phosphatase slr0328 [Gammaproteobacteria bacterium]
MVKILFVCMGNICRSPTAHGVFRDLIRREQLDAWISVDSAGTHAYHIGEPPDRRSQETARRRGVEIRDLRARQVTLGDFLDFDQVLAMDQDNFRHLNSLCPRDQAHKLRLFMDCAEGQYPQEVPDPYYGGPSGFDTVFDMVSAAAAGLLAEIQRQHRPIG